LIQYHYSLSLHVGSISELYSNLEKALKGKDGFEGIVEGIRDSTENTRDAIRNLNEAMDGW